MEKKKYIYTHAGDGIPVWMSCAANWAIKHEVKELMEENQRLSWRMSSLRKILKRESSGKYLMALAPAAGGRGELVPVGKEDVVGKGMIIWLGCITKASISAMSIMDICGRKAIVCSAFLF